MQRLLEFLWEGVLPRARTAASQVNLDLLVYALAFLSKWAIAWLLLTLWNPGWLPGSAAINTAAEVLPAAMVSIFVFIFGSLFVVSQQAISIHSNRAALLLGFDAAVQRIVVRALMIAVATLCLALLIPDSGAPTPLASFTAVLVAATAIALAGAAALLPSLLTRTTAPASFALFVVDGVERLLLLGGTPFVVYRVGALGEMLKRGLRAGDSLQVREALRGMSLLQDAYIKASESDSSAREHEYEQGLAVGWLGAETVPFLVSAGQESIALDAPNEDSNAIAAATCLFGVKSAEAGHREEFICAVEGIGQMATCSQQKKAPGMVLQFSETIYGLAALTGAANKHLDEAVAAQALATWALGIAYAMRHLGGHFMAPEHPYWKKSLREIGRDAPFDEAHRFVDSPEFIEKWANHLVSLPPKFDPAEERPTPIGPGGAGAIHEFLTTAAQELNVRSGEDSARFEH
jgi:hypothetical protein